MSNQNDKIKNSSRRYADEVAIQKQYKIAREYHRTGEKWSTIDEPHRMHKMHAMNCGDPKCAMCGNPRKFFKERSIQEKKFLQDKFHHYDDDDIVRGYN